MASEAQILTNRPNELLTILAHLLLSLPSMLADLTFCRGPGSGATLSTKDYVRIYQLFMQNKPNVKDAKINVNSIITMRYEKLDTWLFGKNKPKTNPIKAKTKPKQSQFVERAKLMQSVYIQKIKKKYTDMGYEKTNPNKPNFFRPISVLNFYGWFYPAVFFGKILVKWTFGYEKNKESKFRSVARAA